jgi:two-component system CheB/CheR fusion protein
MSDDLPTPLPSDSALVPSTLMFPVVGLGASAGGVAALITFFENMPADSGAAFVVVLHLSPRHASSLPTVLQAATRMNVSTVTEAVPIEPDHVYVIPPNRLLSMNDGYLRVTDMERARARPVAADLFFRTLTIVHRERAVAVVLSGTGSDGAFGLGRVKGEGGITLAQTDAEFDGMPRAAIATGSVDWELPVAEMPRKLVQMWRDAPTIELPPAHQEDTGAAPDSTSPQPGSSKDAEEALRDILVLLRARTGHDFRSYKRATVLRRLERRLQVHGLPNLQAYRAFLQTQVEEAGALLKDLLIGVTNFFRDQEAFNALQREVVRRLFEHDAARPEGLRAWVSGCATGEEAYSLAMLMCEEAATRQHASKLHVFATDIDENAIAIARLGIYPPSIEADVSPTRLRRFFDKEDGQYRIRKEVREKVMFAAHNILRDPPFSKLDLISCRNLLIYLDREVHNEILEMFHFALKPGGYLFLGSSESADTALHLFSVVDKKQRIYRAKVAARSARFVPALPMGSYPTKLPLGVEVRPEKRNVTYAELHQRLAEQYAPPSVLIDGDANIVHVSEKAGRFLHYAAGAPTHHLLTLVQPELRLELRTAIFQALRSGKSMEARRVQTQSEGRKRYVNMIVRPVQEPELSVPLVLVLFDEVEDSMASDAQAPDAEGRDPLVAQLEEELRRTKEQLQSTIEHSETSTEELKASNEELQAINEELRSTTEELETSKEELQSMNEELITVNHELKTKVEETGKINDDLQNLIASTDIATVFVDRGMSIKRYTPHATKLFNLIPTDVGRSLLDITHRLDYDLLADDASEAFQSLRVIEREVASQDGKWYLARVPYRTTEDRIDGAVLTFVDVTSRRQAEESMRLVAESTKDHAIITFGLDGRVTTWNKGAERIFGYTDSEMLGQDASMLFLPEERESGALQEEMRLASREGSAEDDRWHLRKDGSRFFCSGITTALYDEGRLKGYAKIARDLTGTKQIERQREAALRRESAERAEAQAANELKDEFLAVVSHELKNPLNLIQLNAELLSRLPEARPLPAVVHAAEVIRKTVLTQAQIIDDLLDLSRMNTGKLTLKRELLDCRATVQTIVEALAAEAADKQLELLVTLQEVPAMIDADRARMEQVVWNLLSNALKFTPRGGRVEVALQADRGHVELTVRDTGRGIDPSFLPRLFQMFQQAEPGTVRRQGGLGIGLALVRHIVELHGGTVRAESAGLDQGTCFTVRLPSLTDQPVRAHAEPSAEQPLRGQKVVVVDDDAASVETLLRLLELEGAVVTAATDVQQAYQAIRAQVPDLVITDIAMPGEDGYRLLESLRADPSTARLPVIALTGFGRAADVKRAIAAGFDAHLKKPLTLDRLLSTLAQLKAR